MPRSIYTKIGILLRQCAATPGLPIDELATAVRDQELDAFRIFRRVDDRVEQDYCQVSTVRKTLYLMADLGLVVVDPVCQVTEAGQATLKDYSRQLGVAIADYFDTAYGVSLSTLRRAISEIKTREAAAVPSAERIYDELRVSRQFRQPIGLSRFSTLVNLLGRCGVVRAYIKKYYWA
jgi:hypothetical protein